MRAIWDMHACTCEAMTARVSPCRPLKGVVKPRWPSGSVWGQKWSCYCPVGCMASRDDQRRLAFHGRLRRWTHIQTVVRSSVQSGCELEPPSGGISWCCFRDGGINWSGCAGYETRPQPMASDLGERSEVSQHWQWERVHFNMQLRRYALPRRNFR